MRRFDLYFSYSECPGFEVRTIACEDEDEADKLAQRIAAKSGAVFCWKNEHERIGDNWVP